jgi:hypothetical protein
LDYALGEIDSSTPGRLLAHAGVKATSMASGEIDGRERPHAIRGSLRHIENARTGFYYCAAILLYLTSFAKLVSIYYGSRLLDVRDPVLGVPQVNLLLITAGIELLCAVLILRDFSLGFRDFLLAWLAVQFMLYQGALFVMHPGVPCKCLGTITEWVPIPSTALHTALTISVILLLGGSVLSIVAGRLLDKQPALTRGLSY